MDKPISDSPIGIFDSGIGGLTVANAVFRLMPLESIVYYADTKHVPYGSKSKSEIKEYSIEITNFLLYNNCKIIVVACNTATAAALDDLRIQFPHVSFIGMEPAVKPAAEATKNNKVGVLATLSTINSERYADLMHRYASSVDVIENPCKGLVSLIEEGKFDSKETKELLHTILTPMKIFNIDTLVLGCTHYPYLKPTLKTLLGDKIQLIDPSPAVAFQIQRILNKFNLRSNNTTPLFYFVSSGDTSDLIRFTKIPFSLIS